MKEFLFWLHLTLVLGYILLGLFFSFWVVMAISAMHRIHLRIFNGCVLSNLQIKLKHFPEDLNFFQIAVKRLLAKDISPKSAKVVGYVIAGLSLSIAFVASYVY